MNISEIKALTFDVFGTVVDWHGTIVHEGERLNQTKGLDINWARFALDWRAGYGPGMNRVRQGELGWVNIDTLHRMILDDLLSELEITSLTEAEIDHLNRVWHRLRPWPDVIEGLTRLRGRFITATLSNGNMALLINMAKHSGLPWDCILSSELVRHYKPDRQVYQAAAGFLGLQPSQVLMVAAHPSDLQGAQAAGLRTAYVPRPLEFGPEQQPATASEPVFDLVAPDFRALATQLGA